MSQHDFDIANQTASAARADINLGLKALASLSSGATAPATTYANMLWYDTTTSILKLRNAANSAWINVGYVDQAGAAYSLLDDTKVVNTSGTQTGLLGDQTTAVWQAGTGTTESLVSPAKVKAAIDTQTVGVGQTWQDVTGTRGSGTSYQNMTGKPIQVSVSEHQPSTSNRYFQISVDNVTWVNVSRATEFNDWKQNHFVIIPSGNYYRLATGSFTHWAELR